MFKASYVYQTEMESVSGTLDGVKAKKMRALMIKTGRKRRKSGGGGNGGRTSGSTRRKKVKTTITVSDLRLKWFNATFIAW